jgi:molybdopterin converting factor small subunit
LVGAPGRGGEALALLGRVWPGARDRVLNELGEVRTHINVFVDGENIRRGGGLDAPVRGDSEIIILPAVSGG